jgi:RNA polymerase sigma factor (sigma-70 family)
MGVHPVHAALTTDYVRQLLQVKARQLTSHNGFNTSEQLDIEQDLAVHVLRQAHHFDPSRACVKTFIARVVDSAVAMLLRDRRRLKRAAGFRSRSLEEALFHSEKGAGSLADLLDEADGCRRAGGNATSGQERAELESDTQRVLAELPPHLQKIAARLVSATEAAIARDLGISRRQVRNAVETIRAHFQKAGLSEI